MPELPDVAGFAAVARQHAARHRIRDVRISDASVLRGVSAREFARTLTGARFGSPRRHGKWLFVPLHGAGDAVLAVHFGMTGSFEWCSPGADRHRHDRVVFVLREGELRYRDMRKLKGLRLTDAAGRDRIEAGLGPDADGISLAEFRGALDGRRRQIKAALTDQAVVAGLGNLLADEILWRARINPRCRADTLDPAALRRLHARTASTVRASVRAARVPGRATWLTGHRDEDPGACPRCGTTLEHSRVGGRSTVSCPGCQPY